MQNSHRFFNNVDCKYFPCHAGVVPEDFNCLFCFCPLYSMGEHCGGNFSYIGENKIKNCLDCNLPHNPDYYDTIVSKLKER